MTGYDRLLYTRFTRLGKVPLNTKHMGVWFALDRFQPATLYVLYPVGSSPPEYSENTRMCILTSTGHDRPLYILSMPEFGAPVDRLGN